MTKKSLVWQNFTLLFDLMAMQMTLISTYWCKWLW